MSSAAAPGTVTMESLMESLTPSTEQGAGGSVLCNHSSKQNDGKLLDGHCLFLPKSKQGSCVNRGLFNATIPAIQHTFKPQVPGCLGLMTPGGW